MRRRLVSRGVLAGAVAFSACLIPGAAAHGKQTRPSDPIPAQLATSWPARNGCARFNEVEISADDRVDEIVWRGRAGAQQTFKLARPEDPNAASDYLIKASNSFPCGDDASTCLLYPEHTPSGLHDSRYFVAARARDPLPANFPTGQLETLILHRASTARASMPAPVGSSKYLFGLRLILRCADPTGPSLYWACDRDSCTPRTFQTNTARRDIRWSVPGPYTDRWVRGDRLSDLNRLLGTPARALSKQPVPLEQLLRDTLSELEAVIDFGCKGDVCSSRMADLRAAAQGLLASAEIPFVSARAISRKSRVLETEESGWLARFKKGGLEAELACARHYHHLSDNNPPHDQCRVGLARAGTRLGSYFPYWFQQIELVDGGGLELQGAKIEMGVVQGPAAAGDQIVITGSALRTTR